MREYAVYGWSLVVDVMLVMVLSISCQLSMIYHGNKLRKERENI